MVKLVYTNSVKRIHHALKLRHHKHTGKLLAHKHTSYRVLFLLMAAPILMLVLVNHLNARASDQIAVSASVAAVMPTTAPVITLPANNSTTNFGAVTVSGTCPTSNLPIIIGVFDGSNLIGSAQCTGGKTFSLPVMLGYGTHRLTAAVFSATGQRGSTSVPVTITVMPPPVLSRVEQLSELSPLRIVVRDTFVTLQANGQAVWQGNIEGGSTPYRVQVDWGDGTSSEYTVGDQTQQSYSHHYTYVHAYTITVQVKDAAGQATMLQSAAISLLDQQTLGLALDVKGPGALSFFEGFVQQYIGYIYICTLSGLVFLWYLEHGRHAHWFVVAIFHRRKRRRHA